MGHLKIVKVLLECGADVDSQDVYGNTALKLGSGMGSSGSCQGPAEPWS